MLYYFQIFIGWLHFESYFWKHLRHFCWRNLIKMKVKAKEREKSHRFNFFLVEGLIVAWCKSGYHAKENAIDFYTDLFCKIWLLRRLFRRYKSSELRHCISWSYTRTTWFLYLRTAFGHLSRGTFCQSMSREFITEVGIVLAEVILELHGSFTLERCAFRYLSRGNFCQSMSLFNKPCCLWSFSSQGTEGFHLSPFTDLLYIHVRTHSSLLHSHF